MIEIPKRTYDSGILEFCVLFFRNSGIFSWNFSYFVVKIIILFWNNDALCIVLVVGCSFTVADAPLFSHLLACIVFSGDWENGGSKFFCRAPHFLALQVQLVVLVNAFMMVSTVWSVSCLLLFYWRCPGAQQCVKVEGEALSRHALLSRRHWLYSYYHRHQQQQ